MLRYHKKIYFPKDYIPKLRNMTEILNYSQWQYTAHCIDRIKNKAYNLQEVLRFIKNMILQVENIFEFYTNSFNFITRICYRIPYNKDIDLILIVGEGKKLITIYYNARSDKHFTLDKALYEKKINKTKDRF